ncbi:efflux RND transporter periplasmic adaptor subunit [Deinococcus sp.]|uniref:efflux RND transporter periplasmic adaptor subunit n=1 Tax=Deinococcus sp. TaxID=47478 RepID=UPI003B5BDC2F
MQSPEASVPGEPTRTAPPPPRRRLPAWAITIPLICLAAYGGYRLGQPAASSQTTNGFGQGQAGGQQAGQRSGQTGQTQAKQTPTGQAQAGGTQAQAGQGAAGATGAAGTGSGRQGTGQAGQGTARNAQTGANQTGTAQGQSRRGTGQRGAGGATANSVTIPVTAVAVKAGTLTTNRSNTGTVASAQTSTVNSRSSGTVSSVAAQVGASVKAGQTVVLLSNTDLNSAVDSARNTLQSAQAQLDNQSATLTSGRTQLEQAVKSAQLALQNAQQNYAASQKVYAVGALAKTDLDAQALTVQQAQATLVTAQANLNANTTSSTTGLRNLQIGVDNARIALTQAQTAAANVKVVAPFDGQLTALPVTGGEYLSAGSPAFSLVSSARTLTFNVPPAEAASLTVGRQLSFVAGQQTYTIKVAQNPGSPTSGTVPITARFIGDSLPALGTVGSVQYASKVGTGTLIPSTALQSDNNKSLVYLIQSGKAKLQTVTVIGQASGQAVISGLKAGVQIIDQPPAGLIDGASISTEAAGGQGQGGQGGGFGGRP